MTSIRLLLVDDEPPARKRVRSLLAPRQEIEIVGECRDGREAVAAIRELEPDLVLLDIQMPELDGFGVIEEIGAERMPEVVFITAYDEYALDAFAVAALDFLLKPFDDERFAHTLERALASVRRRRAADLGERLSCLVAGKQLDRGERPDADPRAQARPLRRLPVEKRGRIYFVPVADLFWIEADGAYVRLHTEGHSHLLRDSLKRLEDVLDPERFVRIHRSAIINVERIREMHPLFHGEYNIVLENGQTVKLSRSYRDRLPRIIGS